MNFLKSDQISNKGLPIESSGPIICIFAEDDILIAETVEHCRSIGFKNILVFGQKSYADGIDKKDGTVWFDTNIKSTEQAANLFDAVVKAAPGRWITHCYNAEFLYFPFCDYRKIADFTDFIEEERRATCSVNTIDLYPKEISHQNSDFDLESAYLDSAGYFASPRKKDGEDVERQIDIFGGLRWRFEEHVPWNRRSINTTKFIKSVPDLTVDETFTASIPELETYQNKWHHSPSAVLCSFRVCKFLLTNPGSKTEINSFQWLKSTKFENSPVQLLNLGFMEPGQWF